MSSAPDLAPVSVPPADRKALDEAGLRPGDVLDGKYQIERVLGSGGMGLVLGALHLTLRQPVALKLLLPSSLADATVVARFEREARAAAMIKSEHVARVLDVGRITNGSPYMVMELLEGRDLEQIVEDGGPLAPEVAANYILQACEAIAEAHAHGIIHRDLKPHNLFLARTASGEPLVKVLDFGISKLPDEREDLSLTKTRDVMGSPLYMAPEQLRSAREVDVRADVWALGAILYRLVTGRTPFDGETMAQLCARVLVDNPALVRRLRPEISETLARVIERCLEKDPAARFADVAALATALDPFATGQVLRPADRILAIASRPPPPNSSAPAPASVPAPPLSMPPVAGTVRLSQPPPPGAFTSKSLPAIAQSELHPPKKRSASVLVFIGVLAIGVGGGTAYVFRDRWDSSSPPPPAPAVTPAQAPSAAPPPPPSVSATPAASIPPVVTPSAEASAAHSSKGPPPKRPPPIKRPPSPSPSNAPAPAPAPAPPSDDAPDLRK